MAMVEDPYAFQTINQGGNRGMASPAMHEHCQVVIASLEREVARYKRIIARLNDTVRQGLHAPSGEPICCCRIGADKNCWYCRLRDALDYNGIE